MNQLDNDVVAILAEPYENFGKYWLRVKVTCETPEVFETELMFDTEEEAGKLKQEMSLSDKVTYVLE